MDVPGWDRMLDGDRGPGLFAQKRFEHGDLAGLYVGVDCGPSVGRQSSPQAGAT